MFAGYFAPRFFPPDYFPGAGITAANGPFLHTFYPARYFTNRYFPGAFPGALAVTPPPPTTSTAFGAAHADLRHLPPIRAVVDVELPALVARIWADVEAARIQARVDARFDVRGIADRRPHPLVAVDLPSLEVRITAAFQRRQTKQLVEDDDDLLLEHYMLSLKGES